MRLEEPQPTYDAPPTIAEWNSMKSYGSFTIIDSEQRPHVFHIGDNIFVLPTLPEDGGDEDASEVSTDDLWIAKIDAIRAQASHNARTYILSIRYSGSNVETGMDARSMVLPS